MCQISLAVLKIYLFVCLPLDFSIYIVMFREWFHYLVWGVFSFSNQWIYCFQKIWKNFIYLSLVFFHTTLILTLQIHIFCIFLYYTTSHCVSIHIFPPFYSLWFSLDSLYCCVLLPNSFILQCLVSCVINANNCSFQYYIFQFFSLFIFMLH